MKEGYVRKSISEICDKASSNIAQNKIADIDGDYPVYGASGYVQNVDFYHRDTDYIGIVKDGSGVGRVNVYPAYSSLLGTMQYIIPKEGYLLGYVAYALIGLNLSSFASGAAIPHIYFKDYGKCKIDVPPLIEQERIVAELDLLQGIIEKKKEQLKAYDQLAQSIFYTMFGDPIDNPKGWETKKLGQVYKLKSGDGLSAKQFIEGQYPVYGGNGISGYHNSFNMDGDYIIIGRVGAYCGNVRYVSGKFWLTDNAFQLIYDEKEQHPVFIKHLLTVLDLHQYANHAAQPVISNITLKEVKVLFPPLSLQEEFAEKVEAIERQKALVQQSIEETQTMFDYTMDKYFG